MTVPKALCATSGSAYRDRRIVLTFVTAALLPAMLLLASPAGATVSAPVIKSEAVSHITSTDATLEATIVPGGSEAGTYYQFQLVEETSEYPTGIQCPPYKGGPFIPCIGPPSPTALPIGYLGHGAGETKVELDLSSAGVTLVEGTTYHYRVLAANKKPSEDTVEWEEPTVFGPDQTFTAAEPSAPTIEGQSISDLTSTDATLEATINPDGLETTYEFLLWESPCGPSCEVIIPISLPSATLPASSVGEEVSLDLNSVGVTLTPGAEYGYNVTASNSEGSDEGEWRTFYASPGIIGEWITNLTEHDVTLNALIDPGAREAAYRFQIDTTGHFKFDQEDACILHPQEAVCAQEVIAGEPLPPGIVEPPEQSIPGGGPVHVSIDLASIGTVLQPGTTYHYRVIASNEPGVVEEGLDQTFTTPVTVPACLATASCLGGIPEVTPPVVPPPLHCARRYVKRHGKCVRVAFCHRKHHRHHSRCRR